MNRGTFIQEPDSRVPEKIRLPDFRKKEITAAIRMPFIHQGQVMHTGKKTTPARKQIR